MKKFSCIIVDDEPIARKILQEFAAQIPFLEIIGTFENAVKAEEFIRTNAADLIFLDIEMPKMSGLQFLQRNKVEAMVILTTAFPQYALEGYEHDIIDYLLKPFALSRFLKAVHKAKEFYDLKAKPAFETPQSYIFVKSDRRIEKVELSEIHFAEVLGNYVTIHADRKKVIAYLTMKSLEAQLRSADFIKIHQSFIVNRSKIESIEGNELTVLGRSLPISRSFRDGVADLINKRLLKR